MRGTRLGSLFAVWLAIGGAAAAQTAPIQVIGDSTFAWNGRVMAQTLSSLLGRKVADASVSGDRITAGPLAALFLGGDITRRLDAEGRDWVVMTGGANDLGDECNCAQCMGVLDDLIDPEGRDGEIVDVITTARRAGARVIYATYYDAPERGGPFSACTDEFARLDTRIAALAGRDDGVFVIDMGDVMQSSAAADYDPDRIHPSTGASARIAGLIAQTIRLAEIE